MARNSMIIDRPASKKVGTLQGLIPFLRPYRIMTMMASVALVVTAGMSLTLPIPCGG